MRRSVADGGGRRGTLTARGFLAILLLWAFAPVRAQEGAPRRVDSARFTIVFFPSDERLAMSILHTALANDSFPWLPRPKERALIAIAPDADRFRQWVGPDAPEWGAALAFPESHRVVMQGHTANSSAGDPLEVVRHELAHLALHESIGNLAPRWFDEGYASVSAHEWKREDVLSANVGLALRGTPTLDQLEESFRGGSMAAQSAYALSYRAVTELASLDTARGLTLFFQYWQSSRSLDAAMRQAFSITLDGFEKMFQSRTRRTYGSLALLADLSLLMLALSVLMLPFFVVRRARDRKRLKAMLVADAVAEKAESESAMRFILGEQPPESEQGVEEKGFEHDRENHP